MAGTKSGGKKSVAKIKAKYGDDFFERIGASGGRASGTGGFAAGEAGRERARKWGAIGGAKSRRGRMTDEQKLAQSERSKQAWVTRKARMTKNSASLKQRVMDIVRKHSNV